MDEREGLEDREDEETTLRYDISSPNLVHELMAYEEGEALCREYAAKAIVEYEAARDSMDQYTQGLANDWRIFAGELPPKKPPYDKLGNLNIPLNLETITRLYFRAAGELFGDWSNVFGVVMVGPDDDNLASVLSRHGNWQISTQIIDFKRQMHRALLMYYQFGDVTTCSFYDTRRKTNRHVTLTPDDFYAPYTSISTTPDWSDVPYRGRILNYYRHDLEEYEGLWYGIDKVLRRKPAWDDEPEEHIRNSVAAIHSEEVPTDGPAPYKLIMHETWCRLPGQGRSRFMRLIVDLGTRSLLSMNLHEAPSWEEWSRYSLQTEQYEAYLAAKKQADAQTEAFVNEAQAMGQDPAVAGEVASTMRPQVPRPPWMEPGADHAPKDLEMSPIQEFTHGVCIEPLKGAFGIGFGRIQADMNRVSNSAVNHTLDASTLENMPPLFISRSANLKKLKLGPVAVNEVALSANQTINDVVRPVSVARATPALMDLVRYVDERARAGVQSPEVLSGEPGKSGETARGLEARIGEATKQISVSARGFSDQVLLGVLMQNARLNTIYMPDDQPFLVNDERGNPQMMSAGRQMYMQAIPYRVRIAADLKFTTDAARVAEADALVAMALQDPMLQSNLHFSYLAHKKALQARGQDDMIAMMGEEPQGPPPPFGPPPMPAVPPGPHMAGEMPAEAAQ